VWSCVYVLFACCRKRDSEQCVYCPAEHIHVCWWCHGLCHGQCYSRFAFHIVKTENQNSQQQKQIQRDKKTCKQKCHTGSWVKTHLFHKSSTLDYSFLRTASSDYYPDHFCWATWLLPCHAMLARYILSLCVHLSVCHRPVLYHIG